jgi:lipopolysaccharide assembly outer membrane protein LptD (OstA)
MTLLGISAAVHILAGLFLFGATLYGIKLTNRRVAELNKQYQAKFDQLMQYKHRYEAMTHKANEEIVETITRRGFDDDADGSRTT